MYIFLIVAYAILCLALIGLILLQRGRGSSTGLTYDPQSSVFGSSGSVSFLVKITTVLAILFFVLGIVISINFRDSLSTSPESLLERTVEAESAEPGTPEDIPAATVDADRSGSETAGGAPADIPTGDVAPADTPPPSTSE